MYVYIDEVACSITWPVTLWGSVHMLVLHQVSGERDRAGTHVGCATLATLSTRIWCS